MRSPATLLLLALASPAFATEPGTPMDCPELELAPGLTCTELGQSLGRDLDAAVDNEGRVLWHDAGDEFVGSCGVEALWRRPLLVAGDETGSRAVLVAATDRCLNPATRLTVAVNSFGLVFDPVRGRLFLRLQTGCRFPGGCPNARSWVAAIDGFTPLADVLPPPPLPLPLCSNGLDDDGDGQTDGSDAHCKSDADNDESRP